MPSKSAGTSRQQNGLLQPPSAIDTDDAAADATAQPADLMELAGCAKFHRGKWDMELLQAHAQNKSLMTEGEVTALVVLIVRWVILPCNGSAMCARLF
jgi:hypothetical protein